MPSFQAFFPFLKPASQPELSRNIIFWYIYSSFSKKKREKKRSLKSYGVERGRLTDWLTDYILKNKMLTPQLLNSTLLPTIKTALLAYYYRPSGSSYTASLNKIFLLLLFRGVKFILSSKWSLLVKMKTRPKTWRRHKKEPGVFFAYR